MIGRLMTARIGLPVVLLLALLQCDIVQAQGRLPVRMKIEPMSVRGRSGGPIPIRVKLEYNDNQIMEGDLILEVHNSRVAREDLSAEIRFEGIVLQGNDYIFHTILPPIEHSYNRLYQIVGWFDTGAERIPLTSDTDQLNPPAPHDLISPAPMERSTLLCSCSGGTDSRRPSSTRSWLNRVLLLDNYNPAAKEGADSNSGNRQTPWSHGIQGFAAAWDVLDLPEDPLHYCAFDVLLLADGALGRLQTNQMEAIKTWVLAGGSLCVLPDGNRLTGQHLQFLQELFESPDDPSLHLILSDSDSLVTMAEMASPIVNRYAGLGRVTLLPDLPDLADRLTDVQIGEVNAHLWKTRRDCAVRLGQSWRKNQDMRRMLAVNGYDVSGSPGNYTVTMHNRGAQSTIRVTSLEEAVTAFALTLDLQPKANELVAASEVALLPDGIEIVPTWVIACLLISYVVVIGPVDYWVLGLLKARKYTWIAFPVVTGLFTWLTVAIANSYMASSDTGGSLSIVDLGDSGQPVRESTLQMHFYSAQTQVRRSSVAEFVVPAQMAYSPDNRRFGQTMPRPINAFISYAGRFPQKFITTHNIRQWEPQTVRTLAFQPEGIEIPDIDWDDLSLVTTETGRSLLASQLQAAEGLEFEATVLHGYERHNVGASTMFSEHSIDMADRWMSRRRWQRGVYTPDRHAIASIGILGSTVARSGQAYFSIVSQVSPQGAASMEDLPILDATDQSQWLLLIASRSGDDIQVFRKLYHTRTPALIGVK